MTKKEMSEIFGVMLLAWPNAEMFKGGMQKLKPTIELWTICLPEVDIQTGQQALVELCRECKFPPTMAEFRAVAEKVRESISHKAKSAWLDLKADLMLLPPQEAFSRLPQGSLTRQAIIDMGGSERLIITTESGDELYNVNGFLTAYRTLLQRLETTQGQTAIVTARPGLPVK